MAKRGELMTEDKIIRKTKMKFEFNINKHSLTFNIRKAVQNLINELRKEDPTLRVKSCLNNQERGDGEELPTDDNFHQHFATKEQVYAYSANKAFAYTPLLTKTPFYILKWKPTIIDYLKQNKVWIKEDFFKTELTSAPGYFTNIHPKATWKDNFAEVIEHGLRKIKLNKENTAVAEWTANNANNEEKHASKDEDAVSIPRFTLNTTVRKWGTVSTDVIGVECNKRDAQYMKHILSIAAGLELFGDAVFVPVGFHLIKGKEALENLLRQNNVFLSELTVIPIEGITKNTLNNTIVNDKR